MSRHSQSPRAAADSDAMSDLEVRVQLERMLSSKEFRASERRRNLLTFVVKASISGATDRLKGYTIATEVFGRDEDFDPQTDPIVRLETSRLRRDLEMYYLSAGKDDPVLISIPKGGNVPAFERQQRVPILDVSGAAASEAHPRPTTTSSNTAGRFVAFTAAAVLAVAVIFYFRATPDVMAPRAYDSVGVLPLDNFSGDPQQQYLADGMTEAITNALGQIESLKVISRTSMMRYREESKPTPTIAEELNVAALVEGSVARSGDRVRVTVQLVDAAEDEQIWSRAFERSVEDVLALQNEVALEIAKGVNAAIQPEERGRFNPSPPGNPAAYEAYLRGRFLLQQRTRASALAAVRNFDQAIELQPDLAHAFAGLAEAYIYLRYEDASPEELAAKASRAATRAVELNPGLPDAHVALGYARLHQYQWRDAEQAFLTALALEPSSARTHFGYATFLNYVGRWDEALAELTQARELDPLSLIVLIRIAQTHSMRGEWDRTAELCLEAKSINPDHAMPYHCLGLVSLWRGEFQDAIDLIRTGVELSGRSPFNLAVLGMAYGRSGRTDDAVAIQEELMELSSQHHRVEVEMAITCIGLGETEQALDWLEKAYERSDAGVADLQFVPLFDDIRSEPRFQSLMERFGFP